MMVLYETNSRIFSTLCTSKHFWCWRIAKKETLKHKIENVCARNERTVLALEAKKMKRANPKKHLFKWTKVHAHIEMNWTIHQRWRIWWLFRNWFAIVLVCCELYNIKWNTCTSWKWVLVYFLENILIEEQFSYFVFILLDIFWKM